MGAYLGAGLGDIMPRMATLPIKCQCGRLRGAVRGATPARVTHAMCYCKDCQAFAHHLDRAADTLDAHGGTELCQVPPRLVEFEQGADQLACIRLAEGGILRWYAKCCNTPIANTPASRRIAFVGLLHGVLADTAEVRSALGPVRLCTFKESATGDVNALAELPGLTPLSMLRFGLKLLGSFVSGRYRLNPFFDAHGGPLATPRTLAETERAALPPYA